MAGPLLLGYCLSLFLFTVHKAKDLHLKNKSGEFTVIHTLWWLFSIFWLETAEWESLPVQNREVYSSGLVA